MWYNRTNIKEAASKGRKSEFTSEEASVTEGGRSILSVANEYGIHENTLWKWKRQYAINPDGAFNGEQEQEGLSAQDRELQQLKRRVRELEEDSDSYGSRLSAYLMGLQTRSCSYRRHSEYEPTW